ncbi:hypothetical protein EHO61_17130 [Leptospira fluminis]|uniref:Uncharacterized protein n=2 Tax=Leptospira fluminis TaxID=2484979 RepID=A0A4V6QKT3_9LEPT|nr:hypothetical protein EHO61_17130 [Leptospira fluminis]
MENGNSIEACLDYLSGKKTFLNTVLASLSVEDQNLIQKGGQKIKVSVPTFSFNQYYGLGRIAYEFPEEKELSVSEILEWKCAEHLRSQSEGIFQDAEYMFIMNPNNIPVIYKRVKEATDLYTKVGALVLPKSDFVRRNLYLPMIFGMSRANRSYIFACDFLEAADKVALPASLKTVDANLKAAFLSSSYMIGDIQRRSLCKAQYKYN